MKVSPEFLAAKKDNQVRSLLVIEKKENDVQHQFLRLCIDEKSKYSDLTQKVFIDTDTDITYENYSGKMYNIDRREISEVCWHCSTYFIKNKNRFDDHIRSFLDAIKKDSDVRFKIVAFNNSELYNDIHLVAHQLYGYINDKCYLLASFVGQDNSASPVK